MSATRELVKRALDGFENLTARGVHPEWVREKLLGSLEAMASDDYDAAEFVNELYGSSPAEFVRPEGKGSAGAGGYDPAEAGRQMAERKKAGQGDGLAFK